MYNKKCTEYVNDRIRAIERVKQAVKDKGVLPDCPDEELWKKPNIWAVKKKGGKRALKLFDSLEEAQGRLSTSKEPLEIEYRPGRVMRCNYCSSRGVCEQYAKMKEQGLIDE